MKEFNLNAYMYMNKRTMYFTLLCFIILFTKKKKYLFKFHVFQLIKKKGMNLHKRLRPNNNTINIT